MFQRMRERLMSTGLIRNRDPFFFIVTFSVCVISSVIAATVAGPPKQATVYTVTRAGLPKTCRQGDIYIVPDVALGTQWFQCLAGNSMLQVGQLGPSGALGYSKGVLDINPAVVPTLSAANKFPAEQYMQGGLSILTTKVRPICSVAVRGTLWYTGNTQSKDVIQACVFDGNSFFWTNLY